MTQTIGTAIAERDNRPPTPYQIVVKDMAPELSAMLPTHIASDSWLRISAGALKKSKKEANGRTELENAAANNPDAFVAALRQAASLGLQPGTDEYYFTTVRNYRNQNKQEILGIVGYQGYVELMYRAGAVESVVVEVVYSTDKFEYVRGVHQRPIHETDWDSDERGELRLAYAYANMKGGAVSKVVVLNKHDIARIRDKSASWKYDQAQRKETSPWTTSPDAMWLKTAARQLRKWVPTSASYITEQLRAVRAADAPAPTVPDLAGQAPVPESARLHISDPDEVVDGEIVDDPVPPVQVPNGEDEPPAEPARPARRTGRQVKMETDLGKLFEQKGFVDAADRHAYAREVLGLPDLRESDALSAEQVIAVIGHLAKLDDVKQEGPAR